MVTIVTFCRHHEVPSSTLTKYRFDGDEVPL